MKRSGCPSSMNSKKVRKGFECDKNMESSSSSPLVNVPPVQGNLPVLDSSSSLEGEVVIIPVVNATRKIKNNSMGIKLESLPPHHYHLGNNKFVVVSEFVGKVWIHIRLFARLGEGLYATKAGVAMSPICFLDLKRGIKDCRKMDKNYTFGTELLLSIWSKGPFWNFQKLYADNVDIFHTSIAAVSLNEEEFENFRSILGEVWGSVTNIMFGSVFQQTVLRGKRAFKGIGREIAEEELICILIDTLKNLIESGVNRLFKCTECSRPMFEQCNNQQGHDCMNTLWTTKMKMHYKEAVALLNPVTVGKHFLQDCGESSRCITEDFLRTLDGKELLSTAKLLCLSEHEASDDLKYSFY